MAQWRSARQGADDTIRFSRTIFLVLVALSAILLAADRTQDRVEAVTVFRSAFNDLSLPVLEAAAQPLRGLYNVGPWWRRQIELANEIRELRQEMAELRAWRDVALNYSEQMRRQQELLNLDPPLPRDRITAWAVTETGGPFVRTRLVGVGSEDGVAPGYPALNIYGVVGRMIDVGAQSSRILLLTDLNSRVSVMADRSNARAMLVGDNTDFPRLDYLGRAPDIREGDRIVTSGDDNILPRGLPIGEAVLDQRGVWRVALYSSATPIDLIWIWPFAPVPAPAEEASGTDDLSAPAESQDPPQEDAVAASAGVPEAGAENTPEPAAAQDASDGGEGG
ncbi:MAG: rod shape-determining protein MreC [Caulobacterales bacterium]|uniref:rod shape-determining protein MreC n=1 Tax=Glycocaulis sp. TaxID=1969725 RepID=UPI003F9ECA94